jgi:hypothetical protein
MAQVLDEELEAWRNRAHQTMEDRNLDICREAVI